MFDEVIRQFLPYCRNTDLFSKKTDLAPNGQYEGKILTLEIRKTSFQRLLGVRMTSYKIIQLRNFCKNWKNLRNIHHSSAKYWVLMLRRGKGKPSPLTYRPVFRWWGDDISERKVRIGLRFRKCVRIPSLPDNRSRNPERRLYREGDGILFP